MKSVYLLLFIFFSNCVIAQIDVQKEISFIAKQYEGMLRSHLDLSSFPQSTNEDGSRRDMPSNWWTPVFFPGSLWYLYEYTNDPKWKDAADKWTMAIEKEQYNTSTHDLGFMIYCAFGNGYRLTESEAYKKIMIVGANSLATRYNPKVGVIKSWENFQNKYDYPVIIDNMMNLEYLLWASKVSRNKYLYKLSISHANKTLENHYRQDYSSYHVVCYGPNGEVLAKKTKQGASDETSWSRGQAWGLYGFTMMYRETKVRKYLIHAQRIADFILNNPNLPIDKIPYWDYSKPGEERDASAGAIVASALLELSKYSKKSTKERYFSAATKMLETLSSPSFKAKLGENNDFILMHCTGDKPSKSEIDAPLVYADYYYLEALLRYNKIVNK